jgi:hypothetical protein
MLLQLLWHDSQQVNELLLMRLLQVLCQYHEIAAAVAAAWMVRMKATIMMVEVVYQGKMILMVMLML